jgi:hypothetical protein
MALDKPDITTGAEGRDEVLRAIADKVREMKAGEDFEDSVKDILSEVDKLLQSPEERRLKQIRERGLTELRAGADETVVTNDQRTTRKSLAESLAESSTPLPPSVTEVTTRELQTGPRAEGR